MRTFSLLAIAASMLFLSASETVSAQKGKAPNGGKSLKGANTQNFPTAESEFADGNAAFDRKEWSKAVSHYTAALQLKPNWAPVLVNRGRAFYADGKLDVAVTDFRKACELTPDSPSAHTWLAAACLDGGDHASAIDAASRAIKLDAKQSLAWYIRGTAFIHKDELAKAIDDLDEAARLNPNDAVIFNNRGIAHQKLGNDQKARADFNRRDELRRPPEVPGKGTALARMKKAEADYKAIDAEIEVYEKMNDTLRRMRPPKSVAIPPQLLQRRAAAWNALQKARRLYEQMP